MGSGYLAFGLAGALPRRTKQRPVSGESNVKGIETASPPKQRGDIVAIEKSRHDDPGPWPQPKREAAAQMHNFGTPDPSRRYPSAAPQVDSEHVGVGVTKQRVVRARISLPRPVIVPTRTGLAQRDDGPSRTAQTAAVHRGTRSSTEHEDEGVRAWNVREEGCLARELLDGSVEEAAELGARRGAVDTAVHENDVLPTVRRHAEHLPQQGIGRRGWPSGATSHVLRLPDGSVTVNV